MENSLELDSIYTQLKWIQYQGMILWNSRKTLEKLMVNSWKLTENSMKLDTI